MLLAAYAWLQSVVFFSVFTSFTRCTLDPLSNVDELDSARVTVPTANATPADDAAPPLLLWGATRFKVPLFLTAVTGTRFCGAYPHDVFTSSRFTISPFIAAGPSSSCVSTDFLGRLHLHCWACSCYLEVDREHNGSAAWMRWSCRCELILVSIAVRMLADAVLHMHFRTTRSELFDCSATLTMYWYARARS